MPRWVGIILVIFGVANVLGAIWSRSEMSLPGIVIGALWSVVGWKQGLPKIGYSHDFDVIRIEEDSRTLRNRRFIAFTAMFAYLPIGAVVFPQLPPQAITTVFFVVAFLLALPFVLWTLSACPKCTRHFYPVGRIVLSFSLSKCQSCGMQL